MLGLREDLVRGGVKDKLPLRQPVDHDGSCQMQSPEQPQVSPTPKGSFVTTMSTYIGAGPLDIPDNVTIPQFFNGSHVSRPSFPDDSPCLIDEQSGKTPPFADVNAHLSSDPFHWR